MNRADLEEMLNSCSAATVVPDSKAQEEVEQVLKHPGLLHIWCLMLGARQAQFAMLSYAPLTNMDTVSKAAVIQGTIRGIEMFRDTLLEQTIPSQELEQEQK